MPYTLCMSQSFPLELGRAPKQVQKAWQKTIAPRLMELPDKQDAPTIKRLNGWKNCWRFRSSAHRLIYRVDPKASTVTMLMIGPRESIYDRLGQIPDSGPSIRIVANESMDAHLEEPPDHQERGEALAQSVLEAKPTEPAGAVDSALPQRLTEEVLAGWSIPLVHHSKILAVKTEGDLLNLAQDVPDDVIDRVMNGLWPPPIEEIVNEPVRVVHSIEAVQKAADGERGLEEFMLDLDGDQRPFIKRFEEPDPKGPWMIKGGPGSGKSTVALYCIKALSDSAKSMLTQGNAPLRVLFTTYTRALVTASDHLLGTLGLDHNAIHVDTINVDQLASQNLPSTWAGLRVCNTSKQDQLEQVLVPALRACIEHDRSFPFSMDDGEFLLDEVEWMILGEGLESLEEYLNAERPGRGRRLGPKQREHLWRLHVALLRSLREQRSCLFTQRIIAARDNAQPTYDFVFIDEAQDLKPAAIRFCLKLAKDPTRVFVTADPNQTIYGASMPWAKISKDLDFRGKTRIFKKNYRTTHEIWKAITPIVADLEGTDRETLDDDPVFHGEYPTLGNYAHQGDEVSKIGMWMQEALLQAKVSSGCGAVLCPTNRDCVRIASGLPQTLNAQAFNTRTLHLAHPGVKVLTMHAAKGLQFPVVAVTGLERGRMPWNARGGMDQSENDRKMRRLFFVACSRAMRRLLVMGSSNSPSPFLKYLNEEDWEPLQDSGGASDEGIPF